MENFLIANVDVDKLHRKINEFICNERQAPYIFANLETYECLARQMDLDFSKIKMSRSELKFNYSSDDADFFKDDSGMIAMYRGNKAFVDDTLKFGEIELR